MAQWKKIFTSEEVIPVANGGTGQTSLTQGVLIANGDNPQTIEGVELGSAQLLIGQGAASNPAAQTVSGDIAISNTGVVTIQPTSVETGMIVNDAVTLAKMAGATKGDLITFNSDGNPVYIGAGSDGQILKANASASNGYGIEWAASTAATTVNISDGDAETATHAVPFVSGIGDATVYADTDEFTFDASQTFTHETTSNLDAGPGTYLANQTSGGGTAALYVKNGIKGDLAGIASGAREVVVDDATGTSHIMMVPSSHTTDGFVEPRRAAALQWDQSSTTLTIGGNLTVNGTTTTVNTTEVTFADAVLKIGEGATDSNALQSTNPIGVGMVVDNAAQPDKNLARFVYEGYQDPGSVLGWHIAQEVNNAADGTATSRGVGVMHVQAAEMSDSGGAAALDIGVGAFAYSTNGDGSLWIQTA